MTAARRPDYSCWLLPAPGPTRARLRSEVARLRAATGGACLEPHLTLVPSLGHDRQRAERACAAALAWIGTARERWRNRVAITGVTTGPHRYQSVMAGIAREPWLLALHRVAARACGAPPTPYRPHVSLVYADLDDARRDTLAASVGRLPPLLPLGWLALYRISEPTESRRCLTAWPLAPHLPPFPE